MKIGNVQLTSMQVVILLLTVATAVIHLILGIGSGGSFGLIFILNFIGYLALWAATYAPIDALAGYRSMARWLFIIYTIITIILFFVFNADTGYGTLGLITKAIEVVLVILLFMDNRS